VFGKPGSKAVEQKAGYLNVVARDSASYLKPIPLTVLKKLSLKSMAHAPRNLSRGKFVTIAVYSTKLFASRPVVVKISQGKTLVALGKLQVDNKSRLAVGSLKLPSRFHKGKVKILLVSSQSHRVLNAVTVKIVH